MSKYNVPLVNDSNSSHKKILDKISPHSIVLEFGPANGVMTKFLKEKLFCHIFAVEIDENAAKDSGKYCEDILVDSIENYSWKEYFKGKHFDYIIFADVLEHLYDPWKVLKEVKNFLKTNGRILISLPNIANNAIIMSLIDNEFEYQKTGLLDDTHIRFFTKKTIDEMVTKCGYKTVDILATFYKPHDTEFKKQYRDFNPGTISCLLERDYGHVYQFIYEIEKIENHQNNTLTYIKNIIREPHVVEVFYDAGNGFNQNDILISEKLNNQGCVFFPKNLQIFGLRLDPAYFPGIFTPFKFSLVDENDIYHECKIISSVGFEIDTQGYYISLGNDPQIFLNVPINKPIKLIYDFDYKELYLSKDELRSYGLVSKMKEVLASCEKELENKNNIINNMHQISKNRYKELLNIKKELQFEQLLKFNKNKSNVFTYFFIKASSNRKLIKDSCLFSRKDYFAESNLKNVGELDAVDHYIEYGWEHGKNPSIYFDTNYYLENNPDIKNANIEPLSHYLKRGWKENRNPSPYFDILDYSRECFKTANIDPYSYYILYDWQNLKSPSVYFDVKYYLDNNIEIKEICLEPLNEYLNLGWKEGRNPCIYFDVNYYLENNQDVKDAALEPLAHYIQYGWKEGRNPCIYFNVNYYLENNQDIKDAGIEPLAHYIKYGWKEGRNPSANFNVNYYLDNNSDVKNANFEPLAHFLCMGKFEGRAPRFVYDNLAAILDEEKLSKINSVHENLVRHIDNSEKVILLTSHDCSKSGAPLLLLNIAKNLSEYFNIKLILLTLKGGEILEDFKRHSYVINLEQLRVAYLEDIEYVKALFQLFNKLFISNAICNTFGGGLYIPFLENYGFNYKILIHEMPDLLEINGWARNIIPLINNSTELSGDLIFSANFVVNKYHEYYGLPNNYKVYPQGVFMSNKPYDKEKAKLKLCKSLNIPNSAKIVVGAGKDFYRKGIDLFIKIAEKMSKQNNNYYFVFITDLTLIESENSNNPNLLFLDFVKDYSNFIQGADVFALVSRDDPLPNMLLDSLAIGLPVIAFDGSGGAKEVLEKISPKLIAKHLDIDDFIEKLKLILDDIEFACQVSTIGVNLINKEFTFSHYIDKLMDGFFAKKTISVIIPNYNYSKFLKQRLETIINQSIKVDEIIFLDDCSTDNSILIAQDILNNCNIPYKIITNEKNMGVYAQWAKGITMASSDLIWIAEADDYSELDFLRELVGKFCDDRLAIAYCQSKLVDENNKVFLPDTLNHTNDISDTMWLHNFKKYGEDIALTGFLYRNIIMNVSAAIFKRAAFNNINLENLLSEYKYCGDWYMYLALLSKNEKLYYSKKSLNNFRRHSSSVTLNNYSNLDYLAELIKIKQFFIEEYHVDQQSLETSISYLKRDYGLNPDDVIQQSETLFYYLLKKEELRNSYTQYTKLSSGKLIKTVKILDNKDYVINLPFALTNNLSQKNYKVAAIIHIFYPDLCEEIIQYLKNIPFNLDIYISTNSYEKKNIIEKKFASCINGKIIVEVFSNKGRDIAPMLVGFKKVFYEYDYFIHLHSKKTLHATDLLSNWRKYIYDTLLGSKEIVNSIFELLISYNIGIVYPQHFFALNEFITWGDNFLSVKNILAKINCQIHDGDLLEFPSGSMFWGRTDAIKPLLNIGFSFDDFQEEFGQVDGTLAHAIERSFLYVAESVGFNWVKISNELVSNLSRGEKINIDHITDLEKYISKIRLL